MTRIAWMPSGMTAESGLIAVMIEPGQVTERKWLDALADRVVEMALQEDDPMEAAEWACRVLGSVQPDSPHELGQLLVIDNWELREWLRTSVWEGDPFTATVSENDPGAQEAIEETDLELWVDMAAAMVRGSGLD